MRFAWLALLAVLTVVGSVSTGPSLAGAQGPDKIRIEFGADKRTVRVMSADQADVREVLRRLFRGVDTSYSIAPEVQGTITIDVRDVSFEVTLQQVLRQVDATYRIEGGVYEIISRTQPQGDPRPSDTVIHVAQKPIRIEVGSNNRTLRVVTINQADVREALERLFQVAGVAGYSIAPDVQGTVTMEFKDVAFDVVLKNLCKQVDATYRADGGVYRITRNQPGPAGDARSGLIRLALADDGQPFETSLRRLVEAGVNYRVEAGNYYLLDPRGQAIAQISPFAHSEAAASVSVTQDGGYLYILRGDALVKVSKKDLKVVARGSIAQ